MFYPSESVFKSTAVSRDNLKETLLLKKKITIKLQNNGQGSDVIWDVRQCLFATLTILIYNHRFIKSLSYVTIIVTCFHKHFP